MCALPFPAQPAQVSMSCGAMGESVRGLGECDPTPKVEIRAPKILGSYRELYGIFPTPSSLVFVVSFLRQTLNLLYS